MFALLLAELALLFYDAATFAAESQAAAETVGLARYYRAYYCDILFGYNTTVTPDEYGEGQLPIVLYTDCKSDPACLTNQLKM